MSKLLTLIFLSILLSSINCACQFGFFTTTSPCDTQANPIQYKMYTSTSIEAGQWAYYYIPLGGIEGNIMLFFDVNGALPDGYLTFQPASTDHLPTDSDYYYRFHVQDGGQKLPVQRKINGIENFDEAIMILGLKNSGSSKTRLQITYAAVRNVDLDDVVSTKKVVVGIIISVAVAGVLLLCLSGYSFVMFRRYRRSAATIQRAIGTEVEAESILENNRVNDHLSLEDVQKYFPKKPFKDLENPFQQIGCSVCLEDFSAEVSCHQLYCNHIFHEACVEKWLEKNHNCPGCRVPIGKKAIAAFLQKQKEEEKKDNNSIKIEITSQSGGEIADEKENREEEKKDNSIKIEITGQSGGEIADEKENSHQVPPL